MLTSRFEQAFLYACRLHGQQRRKGAGTPYIAHLMAVTALVLEHGGDEDQAIAALLHDAVEDQGGRKTLGEIRARFGERVANMVAELSDSDTTPKPPWRERKRAYLAHLPHASPDVLLISLADKLHNARAILRDYRALGEELWPRFKGGKEGTLWYYRELVNIFRQVYGGYLVDELAAVVSEIERLAES